MREFTYALVLMSAGCSGPSPTEAYTLYRSSPFGVLRVHFASFNTDNTGGVNRDNCEMTARLLNANAAAFRAKGASADFGFWCEPGSFNEKGSIPGHFDQQFPTDVD